MKNNKSIKTKYTVFACDTESSTDTGKVWAVQCAPLDSPNDDVLIYNNFDELLDPIIKHQNNVLMFYFLFSYFSYFYFFSIFLVH